MLLSVCVSFRPSARATRRDGGHRERGRRGHGQVPRPAAAGAHGTRRGAGRLHRGGQRTSARAQPFSPAVGARPAGGLAGGEPRGEAGVRAAAGPALPPQPPAWCSAERWMDVGPPRSPQRPNERHRGCGGRRSASAAAASIPPAAPPLRRGTPRRPDATAFPTPPSPSAAPRPPPGRAELRSAAPTSRWPGVNGQRRCPAGRCWLSLRAAAGASFVGEVGSGVGRSSPPCPRGSAEVPSAGRARVGCGRARSCPAAGAPLPPARRPPSSRRSSALAPSLGGELIKWSCLPGSGKKGGNPSLVAGVALF